MSFKFNPITGNLDYYESASTSSTDATSIQGFNVTTTDPTDGKILVYRTSASKYVLEDKPVAGANPAAADVTFTPAGDIVAINVQDAIEELDAEKASRIFAIAMAAAL